MLAPIQRLLAWHPCPAGLPAILTVANNMAVSLNWGSVSGCSCNKGVSLK